MTGVELAVGYVFAWAVRKARRVAGRIDDEVDHVLDARMDHLHEVVVTRLGTDPALEQTLAEAQSEQSELSARTRLRLQLALEEAADQDPSFAAELESAVTQVGATHTVSGNTFNGPTAFQLGEHNTQHNTFGS